MHSSRMRTARSSSRLLEGGVCLSACWDTHPLGVGLETPRPDLSTSPWVWAWRPPQPDPSTSPWVWAWRPPTHQTPRPPPWVWVWRPARHTGIPAPPVNRMTSFAGGKKELAMESSMDCEHIRVFHCYRPQRSWAKVIFSPTCVKNSVHRVGGCLPQCMLGYPPGTRPPGSRHPPGPDPPGSDTPPDQTPPGPGPRSRHPPGADTHPRSRHPHQKQTAAYGQRAAGTHPTGMHSCFLKAHKLDLCN